MPPIYWTEFTWEAFATLSTGVLAVAGAVVVGLRQADIQRRQAAISARQVALDELKLRSDLFERRYAVYKAAQAFLNHMCSSEERPPKELDREFHRKMDESQFLFHYSVRNELGRIYSKSLHLISHKTMMEDRRAATGSYGENDEAKEEELFDAIVDYANNLANLFGEELRLSDYLEIEIKDGVAETKPKRPFPQKLSDWLTGELEVKS